MAQSKGAPKRARRTERRRQAVAKLRELDAADAEVARFERMVEVVLAVVPAIKSLFSRPLQPPEPPPLGGAVQVWARRKCFGPTTACGERDVPELWRSCPYCGMPLHGCA